MSKDTILKVEVEDNELVIRIGADVLAFAMKQGPFDELETNAVVKVTEPVAFLHEMKKKLTEASTEGSTLVGAMLDAAALAVLEDCSPSLSVTSRFSNEEDWKECRKEYDEDGDEW